MSVDLLDSDTAYALAVRRLLDLACRTVDLFDLDLARCGLAGASAAHQIERFLSRRPDARIRMLLHDTSALPGAFPRLVEVFRRRSHQFSVQLTAPEHRAVSQAFVVTDGAHAVTRFHMDHARGKLLVDEALEAARFTAQFETLIQASTPAQGLEILAI